MYVEHIVGIKLEILSDLQYLAEFCGFYSFAITPCILLFRSLD